MICYNIGSRDVFYSSHNNPAGWWGRVVDTVVLIAYPVRFECFPCSNIDVTILG